MKLPSLLLVNTVRSPGNHLEKVVRTAIVIPQISILSNNIIADYDKKDKICTYILTEGLNYKENIQIEDIMLHIFLTRQHCSYLHQQSKYMSFCFRKPFKEQKFHYRNTQMLHLFGPD